MLIPYNVRIDYGKVTQRVVVHARCHDEAINEAFLITGLDYLTVDQIMVSPPAKKEMIQ